MQTRKTLYQVILFPLVLTVLIFSTGVEAQRSLPDNNLSYPILIELKPGGMASGFYLRTDDYTFFVTARHVLFNMTINEVTKENEYNLVSKNADLLSYSSDITDPSSNILTLNLETLNKAGEITFHRKQDIAVIRIAKVIKKTSSNFSVNEFESQKKDVQTLCNKIKSEGYEFGTIDASENTIDWLNRILELYDLSDKITAKKPKLTLTDEIKKLKEQIARSRKGLFADLKDDEKKAIKRLNRLTIELAYPQETPKIDKLSGIAFIKGVKPTQLTKLGILSVPISNIKRFDEVLVSNDIYVFGYPSSIGLKEIPQLDYKKPLLRKGIIAGKNERNNTIILDCPIYYGNSGGPVIEVDEVSAFETKFRLIGVISQIIPFAETWHNTTQQYSYATLSNSGYSVATSTEAIFDLIKEYTIGPTLNQ